MTRTHADDTTIAYIAIGAYNAIQEAGGIPDDVKDTHSGEDGFIGSVIAGALLLDTLADAVADFDCVFNYEVAEPYGHRVASALITRDDEFDAEAFARELITKHSC